MQRPARDLATTLFTRLAEETADPPGITRAAYGAGENLAHALVRQSAKTMGCECVTDAAGNLYMTFPGRDRAAPGFWIGSHMDSVPHGGNFDGAAGVIAGLALIADLRGDNQRPARDITVMAIRAEEAAWFPLSYAGSHAAFGKLPAVALETPRSDTGETLAWHMKDNGFDPDLIARGKPQIDPGRIGCFIEVHIEQGPRLIDLDSPVGLVSGIAGGFRHMDARIVGRYAHSGAEPRATRADAVLGFADLMRDLEECWDSLDRDGLEATITIGRIESDPAQHGGSKVLGEVGFTLDVRSIHETALTRVSTVLSETIAALSKTRGVELRLGECFSWPITAMSPKILTRLESAAKSASIEAPILPSGAGHDAAVFAAHDIPTGMVFIRNENGSHNPEEAMSIEDFGKAVDLLRAFIDDA